MYEIPELYASGKLTGYDPEISREAFRFLAQSFYTINHKNFKAVPDKFMLYEVTRKVLGKDTPNYPQLIGDPLVPETQVLMANGVEKPLEKINIGEVVLNHRNEPAKVSNTIKKNFTGDLVTIKVKGWNRPVTATETHHGTIFPYKSEFQYDRGERRKFGQMRVGDYVLLPFGPDTTRLPEDKVVYTTGNVAYGLARPIESITRHPVSNQKVYCITTENEYTAIFNGTAQHQCVSFAAKNCGEYLQCCEILLNRDAEKFRFLFPPFFYGVSRCQIGGGRLGNSDGSSGSWMAEGVMKYGALAADEPNVPKYSGQIAKQWGYRNGPPKEFLEIGKKHLIKSAALIRSWDELCAAISSGYPVHICSDQGFRMEAGSGGFHEASGSWAHAMTIIGYDNKHAEPYGIILNSWGENTHGILKDFETGVALPGGCIRARRRTIERMISQRETFAYSQFEGFPDNSEILDRNLFDFVSDWRW